MLGEKQEHEGQQLHTVLRIQIIYRCICNVEDVNIVVLFIEFNHM